MPDTPPPVLWSPAPSRSAAPRAVGRTGLAFAAIWLLAALPGCLPDFESPEALSARVDAALHAVTSRSPTVWPMW